MPLLSVCPDSGSHLILEGHAIFAAYFRARLVAGNVSTRPRRVALPGSTR